MSDVRGHDILIDFFLLLCLLFENCIDHKCFLDRSSSLSFNQDEAAAKKKQEAEEAKMKPEALKKLQEERRLAEEHDSSKTAHLSKLGSKFMPAKKKNSGGDVILERGGGGRGRGRGRGH